MLPPPPPRCPSSSWAVALAPGSRGRVRRAARHAPDRRTGARVAHHSVATNWMSLLSCVGTTVVASAILAEDRLGPTHDGLQRHRVAQKTGFTTIEKVMNA
eukprot:gene4235-3020_t